NKLNFIGPCHCIHINKLISGRAPFLYFAWGPQITKSSPENIFALPSEKCGPPPNISNASTKEKKKDEYKTEERVEYSCIDEYKPDTSPSFSKYLTCVKGEWKGDIYCLKPCIVTEEEMDKRGIKLKWVSKKNIISTHEGGIDFACQDGKKFKGQNLPRQICNDGVMHLPECEE
uniref:Sushi domain-containing protein n=1 Tax=Sinocyclocheilus grahami TaxID=75366 RepID=A0A672QDQ8_SINGR